MKDPVSKERLRITLYSQVKKEDEEKKTAKPLSKKQQANAKAFGSLAGMKRPPVIRMQQQVTDEKVFNLFKDLDSAYSTKATQEDDFDDVDSTDGGNNEVLDKDNLLSLVVNLLQNSFACYMKLSHYTEAEKCAQYIKSLQPDYLRTYLYTAQIAYYNKAASIQQVKDA